jgi:hypothetical protein
MAVKKICSLKISDIGKDNLFILDINILYFIHSGYYITPGCRDYNKYFSYSTFVSQLLSNGNKLYTTSANLQELFYGIENKEYFFYAHMKGLNTNYKMPKYFSKKDYRWVVAEKNRLKLKFETIFKELNNTYLIFDTTIFSSSIRSYIDTFDIYHYDPIDYIMVDESIKYSRLNFISDDSDFTCDSRIEVYTI